MVMRDMDIEITPEIERKFITHEKKKIIIEKTNKELKKLLIIGPALSKGCHFSENIYEMAVNDNIDVKYYNPSNIGRNDLQAQRKEAFKITTLLSKLGNWRPQLILVDECGLFIQNCTNIPLFYHHREFKRPPSVDYPTVVFFWNRDQITYYERQFAPLWMAQVPYKEVMQIATNPTFFKLQEKTIKGIIGIGGRESFKQAYNMSELANIADLLILDQETEAFKKKADKFLESPITDEDYRRLLPQCETCWIPISTRQYHSRRMLDAMICKTICIIKLEDKRHEDFLLDMGFRRGIHYIGIDSMDEINSNLLSNLKGIKPKDMINSAYSLAMRKHTYKERWETIKEFYYKIVGETK